MNDLNKIEAALKESEEKYRTVADYTYDWEYWISEKGDLKYVSPSCKRITGYNADEFQKNPELLINITHPEDKSLLVEHLHNELNISEVCHLDFRIISKEGKEYWISHYCQPVYSQEGLHIGRRASNRDISERKRIEAELVNHAELIKQFANTVAHDLKNPAISIYGLIKIIKDKHQEMSDEKFDKFCEQILINAEQISVLADDINTYLSTREAPLHLSTIDLKQLYKVISEEYFAQLSELNISWNEPDFELPKFKADKHAILRTIRNLVDNAVNYGGKDLSEISLLYNESNTHHIVSVQNNGTSIPAEDCEVIFDTFKRGSNISESTKKGTGLGLSIVRQIAEKHHGRAWVTSSQNSKTTFCVSIIKNL